MPESRGLGYRRVLSGYGGLLKRLLRILLAAFMCLVPGCGGAETPNPFGETIRVLEQWTAAHWGRDCFVWIVYYPEELIEPWVEAEALRVGMSEAERRSYRETFVSELRMGKAEAFLVSVYSFGSRPVSLAPVSDNILLVTSSGERLRPVRYDSGLDRPLIGLIQGLVFFPKQRDTDFAVAVKGMGVHDERIFSFAPAERPEAAGGGAAVSEEMKTVIVELPQKAKPKASKRVSVRPVPSPKPPEHPAVPMAPPVSAAPLPTSRAVPPLLTEDSSDIAGFVESLRGRAAGRETEEKAEAPERGKDEQSAYVSREQVLRRFLAFWMDSRPDEMYAMLSVASQKMITPENFARETAKAADFRAGLKDGYRIDWIGEERAKVITDRRFLMFRSLVVRTLGVVREGAAWKVIW